MAAPQRKAEVDFMLGRAAGILLASGWQSASAPKQKVGVKPVLIEPSDSERLSTAAIHHPGLLFALNVVASRESFQSTVSGPLDVVIRQRGSSKRIDYRKLSEDTIGSHRHKRALYKSRPPIGTTDDHRVAAWAVAEYARHCGIAQSVLKCHDLERSRWADRLRKALDDCERLASVAFDRLSEVEAFGLGEVDQFLNGPMSSIEQAVPTRRGQSFSPFFQAIGDYASTTRSQFERLSPAVSPYLEIRRWRECFASLRTGLGPGSLLFSEQLREPEYLYEVWCFAELMQRLIERKQLEVVQCSFLSDARQRHSPRFAIGTDHAYYNFYGDPSLPPRSKVLTNSHVEWMILDPREPRRGIVIDAKYKDERTSDVLTLLGYMNDFDVDRGLLFTRRLQSDHFQGHGANERFVECRFGPDRGRSLFAVELSPNPEADNRGPLDHLIDHCFATEPQST